MGSITVPTTLYATCPTCEAQRAFILNDGDTTRLVGVYICEDCDRSAELHLDP